MRRRRATSAVRLPAVAAACETGRAPEKQAPGDQKLVTPGIALLGRFPTLGSRADQHRRRQSMGDRTPVLIGAGQFTYRGDPAVSPSPTALLKIAAERAAADAGIDAQGLAAIDTLAVVGF